MAVMQNVSISNRSGYEALLRIYRETDLSQEKTRILGNDSLVVQIKQENDGRDLLIIRVSHMFVGSLASCPDPDIVLEVLNFLLSSEVS